MIQNGTSNPDFLVIFLICRDWSIQADVQLLVFFCFFAVFFFFFFFTVRRDCRIVFISPDKESFHCFLTWAKKGRQTSHAELFTCIFSVFIEVNLRAFLQLLHRTCHAFHIFLSFGLICLWLTRRQERIFKTASMNISSGAAQIIQKIVKMEFQMSYLKAFVGLIPPLPPKKVLREFGRLPF